jgi:hypothetical protein
VRRSVSAAIAAVIFHLEIEQLFDQLVTSLLGCGSGACLLSAEATCASGMSMQEAGAPIDEMVDLVLCPIAHCTDG